ncbi:MAG: DNA repair protein RadC [Treponema sp.]|nr:DNA repair protein RadC [Candidatus Treponema caballi]
MTEKEYHIGSFSDDNHPDVREQAERYGVASLSDTELLMLILGTGRKGQPVSVLAERVLQVLLTTEPDQLQRRLMCLGGMGLGKTTAVLAAFECGRRFAGRKEISIRTPHDIVPLLRPYALEQQEHFLCVSLNGAHEILKIHEIGVGTLNRTLIHPREIFAEPVINRAAAVIVAHNHPSGTASPSSQDVEATKQIMNAGAIMGIQLLDHIIVTKTDYYSFREKSGLFTA